MDLIAAIATGSSAAAIGIVIVMIAGSFLKDGKAYLAELARKEQKK